MLFRYHSLNSLSMLRICNALFFVVHACNLVLCAALPNGSANCVHAKELQGDARQLVSGNSLLQVGKRLDRRSSPTSKDMKQKPKAEYVLTWEVPQMLHNPVVKWQQRINVTNSEARKVTGPLTLLLALRLSGEEDTLKAFLDRAHQKRHARIHIIGASSDLEPLMLWKTFLCGPLSKRNRDLVDTFGLPHTPLAGVRLSFLFNGDLVSKNPHRQHKDAMFTAVQSSGFYHHMIHEMPDLVMAINPGFAHYAQSWWPTLRRLQSLKVPILATGFGQSFEPVTALAAVYKVHGTSKKIRLTSMKFFDAKAAENSSSNNICSDRDGNALLASKAGYAVVRSARNPFIFCHWTNPNGGFPWSLACDGSTVFSLLQPRKLQSDEIIPKKVPSSLVNQILRKSLPCYPEWQRHRHCMEQLLSRKSRHHVVGLIDSYLDKVATRCHRKRSKY